MCVFYFFVFVLLNNQSIDFNLLYGFWPAFSYVVTSVWTPTKDFMCSKVKGQVLYVLVCIKYIYGVLSTSNEWIWLKFRTNASLLKSMWLNKSILGKVKVQGHKWHQSATIFKAFFFLMATRILTKLCMLVHIDVSLVFIALKL
jgi:hypothetical protein